LDSLVVAVRRAGIEGSRRWSVARGRWDER